jgi:organic radical activating enzyme
MTTTACINEIFSSLQGEGAYLGEKMTFIRFAECSFGCNWCDTDFESNKECKLFAPQSNKVASLIENPVGIVRLTEVLEQYSDKFIAITGGEPLEQVDFLRNLLPDLQRKRKILLETNGVHHKALKLVSDYIDVTSMDIKLPSSTGKKPFWNEHQQFIHAALESGKELYIKLVVTATTTDKDINEAIKLISSTNRFIPVFIQPVTPSDDLQDSVSDEKLLSFKRLFGAWLPNVSITPQMHKEWDIK